MVYEYTEGGTKKPKTYKIEIGLEVNSFGSDIWYFCHDQVKISGGRTETGRQEPDRILNGTYVKCKAWQTAEIQAVLDLFTQPNILREREMNNYYNFPFQVVNAVQSTSEYTTGTFFGYTPFIWSDDNMFSSQLDSVSSFSSSTHPHRHVIFMGPQWFNEFPEYRTHTGVITADSMARAEGIEQWIDQMPRRETTWNVYGYTVAEMKDIRYDHEIHNGVLTKVIQWSTNTKKDHVDPRWRSAEPNRGITGPPIDQGIIDEKYVAASANTLTGEIKWFQPDCIQMLPLVKL